MKRIFALLTALVVSATSVHAKEAKSVTIPFKILKSGHMTVEVKVNGKGPYTLIFDTGAPITLLNTKIGKEAGLTKGGGGGLALFGMMGQVTVKELQVGEQKVANSSAVIMNHPTVSAISKVFGPIDGIVGFPFFACFEMTLDYKAKTMTMVPNGFKPPNVMASMQKMMMGSLFGGNKKPKPIILTTSTRLGISVDKKAKDKAAGVTVSRVLKGGAADKAGLKKGDRLLTLDDRWTDSLEDTFSAISFVKPGETIELKVKRGDKTMTLKVTATTGF